MMSVSTRMRGVATRAANELQATQFVQRMPSGTLLLAGATLLLVIVPFARAAGADPAQPQVQTTGGATPGQTASLVQPRIAAKLDRAHNVGGSKLRVSGRISAAGRGKAVVRLWVRASDAKEWRIAASKKVYSGDRFKLGWEGKKPGRYMTRVSVHNHGRKAIDHTGRGFVFRKGHASYYGPGLYGGGLACGGRLSPSTVGVAHKTLPCGTRVSFTIGGGRVITARVIDRGPFIAGRDWDLTTALKRKLRFGDIGEIYATH